MASICNFRAFRIRNAQAPPRDSPPDQRRRQRTLAARQGIMKCYFVLLLFGVCVTAEDGEKKYEDIKVYPSTLKKCYSETEYALNYSCALQDLHNFTYGFEAKFDIDGGLKPDQLKWTYEIYDLVSFNFRTRNESDKLPISALCDTLPYREMRRAGTVDYDCGDLKRGTYTFVPVPIEFTQFFPRSEREGNYVDNARQFQLRLYSAEDRQLACVMFRSVAHRDMRKVADENKNQQ